MKRHYDHLLFNKQWELTSKTLLLLGQCEAYIEAIKNTPILPHHYKALMNVALLKGAQATTAIEGNTLTEEEIQKIMDGQKLPPSKEYQQIEIKNILAALNGLLSEIVDDKIDHLVTIGLLKRFHKLVGKDLGEHFAAIPGQLRNSDVIVGRYRCPDYRDVEELLNIMCEWLKREFSYGEREQSFSEIIIQAIVTHVYIEWIHPFGDGNGRTGRLIEFYLLLRGGNPDISSHILSNHYNQTRPEYYRQLEKSTDAKDLTAFIEYALLGFRDGLRQTLEVIQKSQFENTWQKLIYDKFDEVRQHMKSDKFKRLRTMALEAKTVKTFDAKGATEMSVHIAKLYAGIPVKTVQRDLEKLVELELFSKTEDKYMTNTDVLRSMVARRKL